MNQHTMPVTFWTTNGLEPTRAESMTLDDLIKEAVRTTHTEKESLPLIKLGSFGNKRDRKGGSLRVKKNLISISGIECDYDSKKMPMMEAVAKLTAANILFGAYTSFSHTAEEPRWRVVCPLSEPMALSHRDQFVARVNGVLGGVLARESFYPALCYYLGHRAGATDNEFYVSKAGRFIDLCRDLEAGAIGKSASRADATAAVPETSTAPESWVMLNSTDAVIEAIRLPDVVKRDVIFQAARGAWGRTIDSERLDVEGEFDKVWQAAKEVGGKSRTDAYQNFTKGLAAMRARGSELGPLPPLESDDDVVLLDELTEDATARAFAKEMKSRLKFDHNDRAWFRYVDGEGWVADPMNASLNLARHYVAQMRQDPMFLPADVKAAKQIRFSRSIWDASKSDPLIAIAATGWNNDPMILGVPGGFVDLTTGELHLPRASDLIRRRTAVAPAPHGTPAPIWMRFLEQATEGDKDLQAYLNRLMGYWLTGDMREEKISFFYGKGGNGKGVIGSVISQIMGNYSYQAPAELFKADSRTNREYQLAKIMDRRIVIASETETKSALAEAFVKELSGNEGKINARDPYGQPFEFRSVAKLLMVGNHAPQLQGRSEAMERRLHVVPFNHVPAPPDLELKEKLKAEYPAILRLAIDGCLTWQQRGLGGCSAIEGASRAYFEEQDTLSQFIEQRCDVAPDKQAKSSEVLIAFNEFARSRGEQPVDARTFKESLGRKSGFVADRIASGAIWRGLSLRAVRPVSLEG